MSTRRPRPAEGDQFEDVVARIADELADPDEVTRRHQPPNWWRQSLASGALAITLLHTQRARVGDGGWDRVHRWLCVTATGPIDVGPGANLHYGAPALAYVLQHAADNSGRYERALGTLDRRIAAITRQRLDTAQRRLDSGRLPALAEFDAIRGLTGLGAYWLHHARASGEPNRLLPEVVDYLVRLTEPLRHPALDAAVPGWWSALAPTGRTSDAFPGGHANHGVAHGVAGPLALLALTDRAGIQVPGQTDAVQRIQTWLDRWRTTDGHRSWWPYWVTPADLAPEPSAPTAREPGRPSWCYGTPGLARAEQLAALALSQPERRDDAERALLGVLTAPAQDAGLTDSSLCHGHAGLHHIVRRVAADTPDPALRSRLLDRPAHVTPRSTQRPWGLLEGIAGTALALTADREDEPTRWDTCLLTS